MKLHRLIASNFQMLSDIDLDFASHPITLVAAANEQGKTSIADAIALAFTGRASRVALKKDYGQLVRDGAKKGLVSLDWEGGKARVSLPAGTLASEGTVPAAIEYVLQASRFASLDDDARRKFLFGLLNAKMGPETLAKRLADKGYAQDKIGSLSLGVSADFAHKTAKAKATECRGSWKTVTGEAYGDKKAETWSPAEIDFNPADLEQVRLDLAGIDQEVARLQQAKGAYQAHLTEAGRQARHVESLRELAGLHARRKAKLDTDEADLVTRALELEQSRSAAGLIPKQKASGEVAALAQIVEHTIDLSGKTQLVSNLTGEIMPWDADLLAHMAKVMAALEATYGAQADPDAATRELAAKLDERQAAYNLLARSVDNDRRDVAASELAAKELADLSAQPPAEAPTFSDSDLANATADQTTKRSRCHQLESIERDVASRDSRIVKAAQYHADVVAWEAIADDLAPNGIPGEMLKDAIKPFNERLRATAGVTGWAQVRIDGDMQITLDGRAYALGSESAKWRADAVLAEAIAHFSGLKILLIDRMDVLDLEHRATFLGWINGLAESGDLDSAVILATLKALPTGFPDSWSCLWLENGVIYNNLQQAA